MAAAAIDKDARQNAQDDLFLRSDRLVALIDAALSRQVSRILHHPQFQAMEARWRGVALLVRATRNAPDIKIKILPVSWNELGRAMERATEFDQSRLFELIYSLEFGTPGGEPFGLLVGDYEVCHLPGEGERDPVGVLGSIGSVAAAAFCPFVAAAAPRLLDLERYTDLTRLPDLAKLFADPALVRWRGMRGRDDSRFVGLVAPHILLRGGYEPDTRSRIDGFHFVEDRSDGRSHLLWGNGAFAFACVAIRRFLQSGWFADLRGAPQDEDGGGMVDALDPFELDLESEGLSAQPPVEVRFTGLQEQQLSEFGLVPLATNYLSPVAVFNSNQSLHEPQSYSSAYANQNARLAGMLQYVLCASRFAHYLKVILREEVGRLSDSRSIQTKLETWLARYTLGNDDAEATLRARFPLRLANVSVQELAGKAGSFTCAIQLQPHFQLDDVATSFHLLTETGSLGAPARATA